MSRDPRAIALRWDGGSLTYRDLDRAANAVAHGLAALGIGTESRVGISIPRSPELIVASLGALKAGAACVPLDPAYPRERRRFVAADASLDALAVVDDVDGEVAVPTIRVGLDAAADSPPNALEHPDGLAYVIYTSGSTGRPKGVGVPHGGIVALVRGVDYIRLGPDEVMLEISSPAFDAATFEIWGALLNGGSLAVYPPGPFDPAELGAFVRRQGVTVALIPTPVFHLIVDADVHMLAGLRQLLVGADVLSVSHARAALTAFPELELSNAYGPTEATTMACSHRVRPADLERPSVPIGRTLAGRRLYVLDEDLAAVPGSRAGEICIGGIGVARGYVGSPAQTAERFVPDPSGAPGSRMYRTGDLGRFLPDGALDFLGRADDQVKVRGFRVELREVETALRAVPAVLDAAVATWRDTGGELGLAGYVACTEEEAFDPDRLRRDLAERLPAHMIPSTFERVDELPRLPSGKLDRRRLPRPAWAAEAAPARAH